MKVWVSGSSGFIGKHTITRLSEAGHTVCGYDLADGYNVLDTAQLNESFKRFKPDVVIHLAAQVFLGPSMVYPQNDALVNIVGTLNVLEMTRIHGARMVLSSSGAVYGTNDRSNVKETNVTEPMSPYGVSKLTAERYVLLWNSLYDMQNVVFRFSSVYGQGRKKTSVNLILDKAMRGEAITISGDGTQTRDFTYVSDIAEALLMATDQKFPRGIYNIGTGTSTSINGLVGLIAQILGKELATEYKDKSRGDPLKNDFNVDRARSYGFKTKVGLRDGLQMLIDEMI